jgi:hypothetical protein
MHDFMPIHSLVGGALIAMSLAVMLLVSGRIAGLSGVFAGALRGGTWQLWFGGGMLATGAIFELAAPSTFDAGARIPLWLVAIAGALVGLGTRMANGCTSGHGLCGMSRLSKRSILATLTFFAVGVATATITGMVLS